MAELRRLLPDAEWLQTEAERLRAIGDRTRLKMLLALAVSELCVCDLAGLVGMTQAATSQHLKVLRAYRLVSYRKQGRMAFYRLADPSVAGLLSRWPVAAGAGGAAGPADPRGAGGVREAGGPPGADALQGAGGSRADDTPRGAGRSRGLPGDRTAAMREAR